MSFLHKIGGSHDTGMHRVIRWKITVAFVSSLHKIQINFAVIDAEFSFYWSSCEFLWLSGGRPVNQTLIVPKDLDSRRWSVSENLVFSPWSCLTPCSRNSLTEMENFVARKTDRRSAWALYKSTENTSAPECLLPFPSREKYGKPHLHGDCLYLGSCDKKRHRLSSSPLKLRLLTFKLHDQERRSSISGGIPTFAFTTNDSRAKQFLILSDSTFTNHISMPLSLFQREDFIYSNILIPQSFALDAPISTRIITFSSYFHFHWAPQQSKSTLKFKPSGAKPWETAFCECLFWRFREDRCRHGSVCIVWILNSDWKAYGSHRYSIFWVLSAALGNIFDVKTGLFPNFCKHEFRDNSVGLRQIRSHQYRWLRSCRRQIYFVHRNLDSTVP